MRRLILICFFMFSSPLAAWDFGETESFACFRELSTKPTKMTIYKLGDIHITWDEHPVEYHFMSWDGSTLVGGGVWSVHHKDLTARQKEWVEGKNSNASWTQSAIALFDLKTRQLSYGEVGDRVSVQMNCISY